MINWFGSGNYDFSAAFINSIVVVVVAQWIEVHERFRSRTGQRDVYYIPWTEWMNDWASFFLLRHSIHMHIIMSTWIWRWWCWQTDWINCMAAPAGPSLALLWLRKEEYQLRFTGGIHNKIKICRVSRAPFAEEAKKVEELPAVPKRVVDRRTMQIRWIVQDHVQRQRLSYNKI